MTAMTSTHMSRRPTIDPSQAASRFAAMGIAEDDDRPEEDRLLSTVHAGVRVVRSHGSAEVQRGRGLQREVGPRGRASTKLPGNHFRGG